jgi:flagellar biosynthesis anti-sigma factor FlgM
MKIENQGPQFNRIGRKEAPSLKSTAAKSGSDASAAVSADNAAVSERARLANEARTALDKTSDVRAELIEDLKGQLEQGTYRVSLEKLAERVLRGLGLG